MTQFRLYFKDPAGFMPVSRLFGDGIRWKDGAAVTDNPDVVEAAMADWAGPQRYVTAVETVKAADGPQTVKQDPPKRDESLPPVAFVECPTCHARVAEADYAAHKKMHGREKSKVLKE